MNNLKASDAQMDGMAEVVRRNNPPQDEKATAVFGETVQGESPINVNEEEDENPEVTTGSVTDDEEGKVDEIDEDDLEDDLDEDAEAAPGNDLEDSH